MKVSVTEFPRMTLDEFMRAHDLTVSVREFRHEFGAKLREVEVYDYSTRHPPFGRGKTAGEAMEDMWKYLDGRKMWIRGVEHVPVRFVAPPPVAPAGDRDRVLRHRNWTVVGLVIGLVVVMVWLILRVGV